MTQQMARVGIEAAELALISGDLAKLTPDQRVSFYNRVCESLGLNPLTQPFSYITLNGKLTLYARKDAADQLRRVHGVSIGKPDIRFEDDWILVTISASTADGRTDSDVGAVSRKDMRGDFGNALMKAVTKAKRRVTLSVCGLGMLDETEVETIADARPHVEPDRPALNPASNGKAGGQHESPAPTEAAPLPRPAESWTLPTLAVKVGAKAPPATGADLGKGAGWVAVQLCKLVPGFDAGELDAAIGEAIRAGEDWTYVDLTPEQAAAGWRAVVEFVHAKAAKKVAA